MEETKRLRPRLGDIIEIVTPRGLAYAQYSHHHTRHPQFGHLLRVLPGIYGERPARFTELAQQPEQFFAFFPLGSAIMRGIVTIVGHENIPERSKPFPLFRDGVMDPSTGRVACWWLWDGEREWPVGELTPEQRRLSFREIINDTLLIERILSDWAPGQDAG